MLSRLLIALTALAVVIGTATPAVADDAGVSITGRLLIGGQPAAGLMVGIVGATSESACPDRLDWQTATTAADGGFTIATQRRFLPATSRIVACSTDYATRVWAGPASGGVETALAVSGVRTFTAAQLAALTAPVLLDAEAPARIQLTGLHGVQNPQVRLFTAAAPSGSFLRCVATAAVCDSGQLAPGRYRIRVSTSDTSGTWLSPWLQLAAGAVETVDVPARGAITGRVRVAGGAKGQRYAVNVTAPGGPVDDWGAFTSRTGTYRLPDLFPGTYWLSVVPLDGGASRGVVANRTAVTVDAGQRVQRDLEQVSGGTVTGRMSGLAADNGQWVGAVYLMQGRRVVASAGVHSTAGPSGPVLVSGVPKGTYSLVAVAGDRASAPIVVRVPARGTVRLPQTLSPSRPALRLSGRVPGMTSGWVGVGRSDAGPTAGAAVTHGRFTVTGLMPGTYAVTVTGHRVVPKTTTLSIGRSTSRTLHFDGQYTRVTATLRDAAGPIAGGWAVAADPTRATLDDHDPNKAARWPAVSSTGRVSLWLAPGTYSTADILGTWQDPNNSNFLRPSPYVLTATAPTTFAVRSGHPVDLGVVTVAMTH